jgi:hypothetical protein
MKKIIILVLLAWPALCVVAYPIIGRLTPVGLLATGLAGGAAFVLARRWGVLTGLRWLGLVTPLMVLAGLFKFYGDNINARGFVIVFALNYGGVALALFVDKLARGDMSGALDFSKQVAAKTSELTRHPFQDADGRLERIGFTWIDNRVVQHDQNAWGQPDPWWMNIYVGMGVGVAVAAAGALTGNWPVVAGGVLLAVGWPFMNALTTLLGLGLELKQADRAFAMSRDGSIFVGAGPYQQGPGHHAFSIFDCGAFEYGPRFPWSQNKADERDNVFEVWFTTPQGGRFVVSVNNWGRDFCQKLVHQLEEAKAALREAGRPAPVRKSTIVRADDDAEPRNVVRGPGGMSLSSDD